jgi:ribonuclease P protein component
LGFPVSAGPSPPQSGRLRNNAEYRKIYEEGARFSGPFFAAFYRRTGLDKPARVGYTTPRGLGIAVARNRIKRRLREVVRLEWAVDPGWELVFNPRRAVLKAEFAALRSEVQRLFRVLKSKT